MPPPSPIRLEIGGIAVNVFERKASSVDANTDVSVLFLLHGRTSSAKEMDQFAVEVIHRLESQPKSANENDLLLVTLDHRNHGARLLNAERNASFETNPLTAATDMYSILAGTASDVSYIMDFLPIFLYPNAEREITQWGVCGVSLGGHSAWHLLAFDPRITVGVPIIGCPDFLGLTVARAKPFGIQMKPPHFPAAFVELVQSCDPMSVNYKSDESDNPFEGKKILAIFGRNDKLVPPSVSEPFLNGLRLGRGGVKKTFYDEEAGHQVTAQMLDQTARFVYDHLALQP